ncbi:hypothetical protein EAX61_04840 [Dokdonia sinensis]|uniref:Uncharacterized protein n=1 Tax=Dokdonia sinensis TaxID=2479847 RepID=A0A3M0GDM4_9FLAO|nr:hypothetical protein [Dokdonia sinensis]RMB62904.1 hypothetical protein EAX61_04840 [Dokdonia sinensis]
MKINIKVTSDHVKTIEVLPNSWNTDDYRNLLEIMDYGDTAELSDAELEEMCLLSLSDNEPNEAAEIVLKYLFKDQLNKGQIANLSHEMLNEHPWEEYSDMSMHETFFNAGQILYKAYNGKFPHPKAIHFHVTFTVKSKMMLDVFKDDTEAQIIRVLAQGMPDNTLLKRLFKEELVEGDFLEAKDIIWQLNKVSETDTTVTFDILSSNRWFEDFKYVEDYEATLVHEQE